MDDLAGDLSGWICARCQDYIPPTDKDKHVCKKEEAAEEEE